MIQKGAQIGHQLSWSHYRELLSLDNIDKINYYIELCDSQIITRDELKKRIDNGRNKSIELVPAKLGAYEALCASASVPVSWPNGVIVVPDVETHFVSDRINIDDSDALLL